jgi:Kelch motif
VQKLVQLHKNIQHTTVWMIQHWYDGRKTLLTLVYVGRISLPLSMARYICMEAEPRPIQTKAATLGVCRNTYRKTRWLTLLDNNFLAVDLTTGWQISSPTIKALPQPSGPPAIANGFLWNSPDTLYLYGGEYSDNPEASPAPYSLWSYNIKADKWEEHKNPKTVDNVAVQRSAEGSGVNIPSLGRGMYFGGHVDRFTTPGWDIGVWRVYLRSLVEFTFPGRSNPAANNNKPAGSDGIWRNITDGGIQESAGFTERADGLLVYVPGYADQGILLGLAGGTNQTYTQMNVIDVYDIAGGTWYKQATTGTTPEFRVNPCAVAASAADGSSVQVYIFGGQTLLPYGQQKQYDDMWILSIPSFNWVKVDTTNQSVPPGRSGHTCTIWNGQMVVVGGYVGQNLSCDSPGVYVFNTSSLKWNTNYVALKGSTDQNQQKAQGKDPSALQGSYGYSVPDSVQKVIGGNDMGSATITAPAQTVTAGPFASGKPITYTVTQGDGSVATETASPNGGAGTSGSSKGGGGPNIAAIVAGVIAGLLAVLAAYLGFCAWVYRRQLTLYKRHVAMSQRQSLGIAPPAILGVEKGSGSPLGKGSLDNTSASSSSNARNGATGRGAAGGYQQLPTNTFAGGLDRVSTNSQNGGMATARSSTDDLMEGQEPTFLGVLLSPRRSLKVINRD